MILFDAKGLNNRDALAQYGSDGAKMALASKKLEIRLHATPESIFADPVLNQLYDDDELRQLASNFRLSTNFRGLGPVKRSHLVKRAFIEHLGYPSPNRFRGENREQKPKFRAQLMDIFVQSSTNLQVWNYLPHSLERLKGLPPPWDRTTFADCRYVIIAARGATVGISRVVKGSELGKYAHTRKLTIKYQATVPPQEFLRNRIEVVANVQGNTRRFAGNKLDSTQISGLLQPLIGLRLPAGSDRQIGQSFHKAVAVVLRLSGGMSLDDGQFPDLPSQLIEVKFQMSPTIDLGMILPPSTNEIRPGIIPANVTYIIGVGELLNDLPIVRTIVVVLGMDFEERFRIWNSLNSKIQITIPESWLE